MIYLAHVHCYWHQRSTKKLSLMKGNIGIKVKFLWSHISFYTYFYYLPFICLSHRVCISSSYICCGHWFFNPHFLQSCPFHVISNHCLNEGICSDLRNPFKILFRCAQINAFAAHKISKVLLFC